MLWIWLLIGSVAIVGHGVFWIGLVNRLHATALPRWLIKGTTAFLYFLLFSVPLLIGYFLYENWGHLDQLSLRVVVLVTALYALLCCFTAITHVPLWLSWRTRASTNSVLSDRVESFDIPKRLGYAPVAGVVTKVLARVPGNQLLRLNIHEKTLLVPRLPKALEGLSIAHLSDLHYAGHVTAPYFREVFSLVNDLHPDLIVITGDICDATRCIPWAAESLGELRSKYGTFYILGNHDLRIRRISDLRSALASAGLTNVGGKWHSVSAGGEELLISGNELPWWGPAAEIKDIPALRNGKQPFRMLLAHTPDQFPWAQAFDFDLMFAGHTHGGQICFPFLGPVVCPSRFGVKYAAGTHYEPPTVLHVSRGISSITPVRFNCPTEVTKVILTSGAVGHASGA